MGRVTVYHPASDRFMDCSDDAFERIYSAEGWELAPDVPEPEPVKKTTARRSSKAKADDEGGGE